MPTRFRSRKATRPGARARVPGRPGVVGDPGVRTLFAREPDFLPMVKGKLGGAVTPPAYRFDLPSRLIQHSTVLALSRTLRAGASAAARHPGQRLRAALCRWAGAGRRDVGSERTKGLLSAPPLC